MFCQQSQTETFGHSNLIKKTASIGTQAKRVRKSHGINFTQQVDPKVLKKAFDLFELELKGQKVFTCDQEPKKLTLNLKAAQIAERRKVSTSRDANETDLLKELDIEYEKLNSMQN